MIRALLLAFVATAAAANAPMSKLAGSRVALPKALPKALELRGGGKPSAELSIKLTQAAAVFYSLQCLFVPDMVRRHCAWKARSFMRSVSVSTQHSEP